MDDSWAVASSYEAFMGRWSRMLAARFVPWLQVPPGAHWLDVGCGTGSLVDAICDVAEPASVVGCDPAAAFVEHARRQSRDARASFVESGIGSLPRRPDGFESVASLLALNFFPDPEAALHEVRAVTSREGMVSACVWDYGDRMDYLRFFWNAVTAVDPGSEALDEGKRFPLCRRGPLCSLFQSAGLANVHCEAIDVPTVFANFDDYWRPLLGGTGPAPSYVASLDTDRRAALAQRIEATLPRQPDGSIALTARAWAIRGTSR